MQALWLGPVVVGQLSASSSTSSPPLPAVKTSLPPPSLVLVAPPTSFSLLLLRFPNLFSARPLLFSAGSDNLLDLAAMFTLI